MWNDKKMKQEKQMQKFVKSQKTSKPQMAQKTVKFPKTQKQQNTVVPKEVWGDYYYMTSSACTVTEIASILQEQGIIGLEVWTEMGVLEWPTGTERSIDMERLEPFSDEEDVQFLKIHEIQSIFSVHISSLDEDIFLKYFEKVLECFGGGVCCDTETFEPLVMGNF